MKYRGVAVFILKTELTRPLTRSHLSVPGSKIEIRKLRRALGAKTRELHLTNQKLTTTNERIMKLKQQLFELMSQI